MTTAAGMVLCKECIVRAEETPGSGVCFHCRVASIGFTFRGGGTYGRRRFNEMTIAERRVDMLGESRLGEDVDSASNFGW